ncbi:TRAP transporter substrate-binding protein DctP [Roseobacter sp. N2S]|uniref:TRAP transporter substrate-binding protein n=1 Tax=Roseobacter sp. N2S TaxID=2663844 RepID=UPI0028605DA3|nr:TRAP transporter substrate-binding protein DctP [Roseobacter sp. N2S]MDR6267741.1 TRAP-type C4-dicarboxylate transport system substrate-binding protein [Roseobacter sp. N2S]
MKINKLGIAASLALCVNAGTAFAQDITLRVADSLPVGHYIAENLLMPFLEDVKKTTGEGVGFEYFPAQQLGKAKDMLSLTQTGVTDIGYIGASYLADKLPLSSVAQLPGTFNSACEGTMAYWEIAKPGGVLDKAEYAPEGVRALMALALPPYQLFSAKELTGVESIKGQKIRTSGGSQALAMTKLGGVPVQMSAPEAREALSRGTVDAIVFPYGSIQPYDLAPHLKTATEGLNLGSFVASYMISQSKYDSLSPEAQQALTEAGERATQHACAVIDGMVDVDKQKIAEQGVQFVTLPEADVAEISALLDSVGSEWTADMDGRNKPGTEVMKAFMDALK